MKKLIKHIILFILALIILFEEWLWQHVVIIMAWLGKLPIFKQLEFLISKLPPRLALIAFIIPALALLPFKLLAIQLFAKHHFVLGTLTYVAAKLVGTAIVARLFQLTRPALMQLKWFATSLTAFLTWKDKLYNFLKASQAWLYIIALKKQLKQLIITLKQSLIKRAHKPNQWLRLWRAAKKLKQQKRAAQKKP